MEKTLFSTFSNKKTLEGKQKWWIRVADKSSALGYAERSALDSADNSRQMKKTGGGPPPRRSYAVEETVVDIIGDAPFEGVLGGVDTAGYLSPPIRRMENLNLFSQASFQASNTNSFDDDDFDEDCFQMPTTTTTPKTPLKHEKKRIVVVSVSCN
ncbi:unnamed protein product [Didymodactylos carnosus]|uniref:Uncharacterized protein n=1 Tax=Didymodactylos carnosus TaxID=1234261 RepID=A0A814KA25_9BILA|nr:unnamed protein product [Didymodactylos carnosus]CAF3818297.1 unnamed protein product [Didymodactylos carnosus]